MRELQADRGTPLTRPSNVDPEKGAASAGPDPSPAGAIPSGDEAVPVAGAGSESTETGADQAAAGADHVSDLSGPAGGSGDTGEDPADAGEDAGAVGDDDGTQGGDPPARSTARRGRALFALVALFALAADILSKLAVVAKLENPRHAPVEVVPHVLYLIHTRNTGAAFSLGSSYTFLLTLVAVGVIVVIVRTARRLASTGWAVALGLVLGGACGNVVDRLLREGGGVVDFLALGDPMDPVWPVFNLADSALCCGVALLVILEFTGRRIDGTRTTATKVGKSKDD